MKNLHYLKKFVVMVLAAMMTLSTFALPTFAAARSSFTIDGLEPGVKATAYKIVKMNSDDSTNVVLSGSIEDVEKPTADEIMALTGRTSELAAATNGKVYTATVAEGATSVTFGSSTAAVEPGLYMVVFETTKDAETIYNPVLIGINNDQTKDTIYNADDEDKDGVFDVDGAYFTGNAYAKSSKIPFDKVVERTESKFGSSTTNDDNASVTKDETGKDAVVNTDDGSGNRGDTAGKDDVVAYRINTMIPAYADNFFKKTVNEQTNEVTYAEDTDTFKQPKFKVYDTLSEGLDLQAGTIKIKVQGKDKVYTAADTDYVVVKSGDAAAPKDFEVSFTTKAIDEFKGLKVEICYEAKVNTSHGVNYNGETNTAQIDYTRNPGEDSEKSEEKTTYHYTFEINGKVNGPGSVDNREVVKVGTDESGNQVFAETTWTEEKGWKPLAGAVFELYAADTSKEDTSKANNNWSKKGSAIRTTDPTGNDGILKGLTQLDAGKYVLVEKTAPADYAKNETAIALEIQATLDNEGRMTNYKVFVNNIKVGDYSKTYGENDVVTTTNEKTPASIGTLSYNNPKTNADPRVTYTDANGNEVQWTGAADNDAEAANIRNSKTGTLPSTGGMGTVLFTVGGVAIMALALFLLFGGKKKQHQK